MKATNVQGKRIGNITLRNLANGEQSSLQSKKQKYNAKPESGSGPKKLLLTREMAAERLGCHWQTVIYREKKGDLTGLKIGGRKYYALEEVEKLIRSNPVVSKPHWSKRPQRPGGGPGSGMIMGCALVSHQQPTKPTLWNRIIAFFVR